MFSFLVHCLYIFSFYCSLPIIISNWLYVSIMVVLYKYEKHFQKMYRDVGMAVPKTTETRCRDGSVRGRHVIQRLHN